MKNNVKLKGKQKLLFRYSLYLGFLLIGVDVASYFLDYRVGLVLSFYALVYFTIVLIMMRNSKTLIMNELISFATEYGQIQRTLLRQLELPYALLDENGKVFWSNEEFENTVHKEKGFNKSITSVFPSVTRERLPGETDVTETECEVELE